MSVYLKNTEVSSGYTNLIKPRDSQSSRGVCWRRVSLGLVVVRGDFEECTWH